MIEVHLELKRGIMKNNLKVLFIQLCVLAIGCFIGEAVFGLPKWLGLVIAGLMFYLAPVIKRNGGTGKENRKSGISGKYFKRAFREACRM